MVRPPASVCALLALAVASPSTVAAHGPCRCLRPASGPVGTRVAVAYPIYKVIFNPDRADLGIGPEALWDRHRAGAPVTVYRVPWRSSEALANRRDSFTVPATRPGRYLVALYDGAEGGQHYSWESFTVIAGPAAPAAATASRPWRPSLPTAIGAAALALAIGAALGMRIARRPIA